MRSFVAAFIVAALVATASTPIVRRLALRVGAVSNPGGRHIHERSVPRLGGLALAAGFFAPLVGLFFVESVVAELFRSDLARVFGLFAGGLLMGAVGAVDDVRGLRALYKLYAQLAVAVLAFGCGYRIDGIQIPLVGPVSMGIFALPVTVAWIVGIINAVNLIDGLDGLAGGVVFFAALTNFVVAQLAGAELVSLLMASTMGAVLGFLFFNFNPARIFMGDSGSYFLGFVLAVTSLSGVPKASAAVALLVPVLALGVPIFDVLFSVLRRVLERRSIFSPDRGHLHHRLLDMGITHRRAVLILYGACAVFAASAIGVFFGRAWQVGLALLVAASVLFALVRLAGVFEYFRSRASDKTHARSPDTERIRVALPGFVVDAERCASQDELLGALDGFATLAKLHALEVNDVASGRRLHAWVQPGLPSSRDEVRLRLRLGGSDQALLEAMFAWPNDQGDVTPQAEVLLQVVVDRFSVRLTALRSPWLQRQAERAESRHDDAHASVLQPGSTRA
jgi:UDP-GlcNAc:undecaprenyl-phosphate GlcNAc-1-phosphate transferase